MPKLFQKLALIFLSSILFLNSMAMPFAVAHAADEAPSTWYNQNPFQWYDKVYKSSPPSEIFGERYTAAQVQWILFSLLTVPISTLETFNTSGTEGSCLLGSLGSVTAMPLCVASYMETIVKTLQELGLSENNLNKQSAIASILDSSNRDISAINYFSKVFSKFSIIKEANAQEGFGFNAIGIVQNMWTASRNAAYAIIVLITIIFAFMIMFRVKLSPQLVISVQSALPKVFMALILATFSFAIAGLMIDLMYVFMGFISAILASIDGTGGVSFDFVYGFVSGNWLGVHVSSFLVVVWYMMLYVVFFFIAIVISFAAALAQLSVFNTILSILFLFVAVYLIILGFIYMIKIPWMLIKALAAIYMSVIIAPLQIIIGAIAPQMGFGPWLKNLIANLLVFPITGIFFWLAYMLIFQSWIAGVESGIERNWIVEIMRMFGFDIQGIVAGSLWSPPLLGSGAEITGLIFAMMSFMVIVAIPKTVDIVKMLVMGAKFDFGTAIGEAMAPVDWARKSAPVRAIGDISTAEGAAKLLGSKIPMKIANKLGYEDNLTSVVNKMKKQVISSR